MNKQTILILILSVFCFSLNFNFAQEQKKYWRDGNDWKEFDALSQVTYLEGLQTGGMIGAGEILKLLRTKYHWDDIKIREIIDEHNKTSEIFLVGATFGQMIDGTNEFYKDYANRNIPVHALATIACRRVLGELDQQGVDKELLRLRLKYSK